MFQEYPEQCTRIECARCFGLSVVVSCLAPPLRVKLALIEAYNKAAE